ncbi:hypothetical protein EBBID32_22570 [Sphingobium indicum BiD32]|uniref:HTH DNA binding domain-containing protein n=1 Tax=Sphingobium indicum BiD32 TaxID=1301087 RepID=N1MR40_9SPHN|nr:hypothetical protein [Sphingobium indicum]CCW17908.1 hypothetical protein EBBID32_22570 [Sphingobium indicum BiD32]
MLASATLLDDRNRLILAYAEAHGALERLEERRRLSPVRRPWRIRTLIAERQALARIDNSPIDDLDFTVDGRSTVTTSAYDLSHWRQAIGTPIALDALLNDGMALLRWLGVAPPAGSDPAYSLRSGRNAADILPAVAAWQRDVAALPSSPPLLHCARIARLWRRHAPIGQGDLLASLLIGDRWGPGRWTGSAGGLIALGLESNGAAWKRVTDERLDWLWLEAISTGARAHLDLETRLRAYAWRAAQHIERRRRPGRLKDVLRLAMAHPRISSGSVARALGLTSAGAIKLLTIAAGEGLLIEQSGQASYRSYALPVSMTPLASKGQHGHPDSFARDFWSDDAENMVSPEAL